MKRFIALVLAFIMVFALCACSKSEYKADGGKPKVVATIFPQYDFARQVAGDLADITMLLSPGEETHTYDPSPADIITIQNADIFIYGGGESDTWIEDLLFSLGGDVNTLRLIDCVEPLATGGGEHGGHGHSETVYDEHVWTSPKNAAKITEEICMAAASLSEENKEFFETNTAAFISELNTLDLDFRVLFDKTKSEKGDITLVFGDRFPLLYFTEEYGLDHISAFPGCSHETEVSASQMSLLIDRVKAEGIDTVFYMDFSNHVIADSISEATGASVKRLYSCHNVTKEQLESGASYISLMRENLAVFAEAFN